LIDLWYFARLFVPLHFFYKRKKDVKRLLKNKRYDGAGTMAEEICKYLNGKGIDQ